MHTYIAQRHEDVCFSPPRRPDAGVGGLDRGQGANIIFRQYLGKNINH